MKNIQLIRCLLAFILLVSLSSCSDELEIQNNFEFKITHLPIPNKIVKGETVEIRCTLEKIGNYENTRYFIRYFQPEGKGELKMDDGTVFLPNDSYPLDKESFRLYYTSMSDERQLVDIYFYDNFGNQYDLSLDFNNVTESND